MRQLLVCTLAICACAQDMALNLDLSGPWKSRTGEDRAEFALPGFDDHEWGEVTVPYRETAPVGHWWMRRAVEIPAGAELNGLVLTIGGLNEVFEVFVNGERLAAVGTLGSFATSPIARARSFALPALKQRKVMFALRLWRTRWLSIPERAPRDEGPWLLTETRNAPALPGLLPREKMATPNAILAGLLGLLAMVLVAGWSTQPGRTDLLLLALFLASEGARRGYPYASIAQDWPHGAHATGALLTSISWIFLTWYAAKVLGGWARLPVLSAILVLVMHSTMNFSFLLSRPIEFMRISPWRGGLSALTLACFLIEAGKAYRRRDWSAMMIAAALTLLVTTGSWEIFWAGHRGLLFQLAAVVLSLVLTVHLIRSLGAARQRLDQELQEARMVQQLLVPESACPGVEVVYQPAQEVGGDFFWSHQNPDGSVLVAVGDVSGKGLKAAMLVSTAIGALRATGEISPGAILGRLNTALLASTGGGFVTATAALLRDGRLRIANAGHLAPYRDGEELAVEPGIPLGVVAGIEYAEQEFDAGRQLTFVSDGVIEAANVKGELFGFDRTRAISMQSAQAIADAAKQWGQNDDITVVTVRRVLA